MPPGEEFVNSGRLGFFKRVHELREAFIKEMFDCGKLNPESLDFRFAVQSLAADQVTLNFDLFLDQLNICGIHFSNISHMKLRTSNRYAKASL
ncbi:MAG TPA: hypothetical protein DCS07_17850 [Bdellovibrionales bacterium]|nr:MAG: hypothetical protein A2Z97_05425 [Bdellovibrionales bacterium GWB1_52_6]OFZ05710.1 MAG: hypothetical protein A2X97_03330 [Bdellovibrionales bacterium GWA1_52_35]OFZ40659.1 MAG: hypothetical protein A2070_06335 [Bdellovibrionales bacterium GWC1_52_8]HAR44466.1 hypothetical protein [Bdellovibrionales bacterium]HCM40352.1 hypothetical protein [Bdellovibrionales bacterium]